MYRKVVDFGALPDTNQKTVAHNISDIDIITSIQATGKHTNGTTYPIPFAPASSNPTYYIALTVNETSIVITCGSDRHFVTKCYVTLEYTKTTD